MTVKIRTIAETTLAFSLVYGVGIFATNLLLTPQVHGQQIPTKTLAPQAVDENYKLKFESGGCKRTGRTEVICDVIVTNLSDKREKVFFTGNVNVKNYLTSAIDTSGTVYSTILAQSGANKSSTSGAFYFPTDIAVGIPTKVIFTFNIPQEITQLSALDVGYRIDTTAKRIALTNIGTIATNPKPRSLR
jgi:hypothetical protein